jgi:hypothetical protein
VVVGTALSLGVSIIKATFVAGVVAGLVAVNPATSAKKIEGALEDEGVWLFPLPEQIILIVTLNYSNCLGFCTNFFSSFFNSINLFLLGRLEGTTEREM